MYDAEGTHVFRPGTVHEDLERYRSLCSARTMRRGSQGHDRPGTVQRQESNQAGGLELLTLRFCYHALLMKRSSLIFAAAIALSLGVAAAQAQNAAQSSADPASITPAAPESTPPDPYKELK